MAVVKVFSSQGIKELKCFENLEECAYLPDKDAESLLVDDGELTVGTPLDDEEERKKLTCENFHTQFPDY